MGKMKRKRYVAELKAKVILEETEGEGCGLIALTSRQWIMF